MVKNAGSYTDFRVKLELKPNHELTISVRFLGKILRVLILEVSIYILYNVYITNQLQTTFAQDGRGGKIR